MNMNFGIIIIILGFIMTALGVLTAFGSHPSGALIGLGLMQVGTLWIIAVTAHSIDTRMGVGMETIVERLRELERLRDIEKHLADSAKNI
jgi:hypothetical protein